MVQDAAGFFRDAAAARGSVRRRPAGGNRLPCRRRLGARVLVCTDGRFAGERGLCRNTCRTCAAPASNAMCSMPSNPISPARTSIAAPRWPAPSRRILSSVSAAAVASTLQNARHCILTHGGKLEDYYGEFKIPARILPVIAVPTTSGTGSEVTPVAVVSDSKRTLKVGISSPYMIPAAAICDPVLTWTCPPADGNRRRRCTYPCDRGLHSMPACAGRRPGAKACLRRQERLSATSSRLKAMSADRREPGRKPAPTDRLIGRRDPI